MIDSRNAPLAEYNPKPPDIHTHQPEDQAQTVAVTVDLASEFQALLSGLCSDGGRDAEGTITKLWKIDGIQSIDFLHSEPGKTMVFNIEPGHDICEVSDQLNDWLCDLRVRRQRTERSLASFALIK